MNFIGGLRFEGFVTAQLRDDLQGKIDQGRLNISDDALAWVIGHELGHCELGHGRTIPVLNIPADSWKDEYDADLVGKRLMQAAGYNFDIARTEIVLILGEVASTTHPDAKSRMSNITAPNNIRYYPSLIKMSKN